MNVYVERRSTQRRVDAHIAIDRFTKGEGTPSPFDAAPMAAIKHKFTESKWVLCGGNLDTYAKLTADSADRDYVQRGQRASSYPKLLWKQLTQL